MVHCTDVRRNAPRVVEIGGAFFMRRSSLDYKVQEWHALNLSFAKLRANFQGDAAGIGAGS